LLEHVRIVGPFREQTQLEVAPSDASALDITPPTRISGDVEGAAMVEVTGPRGSVMAPAIIAQRHLHCDSAIAAAWGIADGDSVSVALDASDVVLPNVVVRLSAQSRLAVHIHEDEAREYGVQRQGTGVIVAMAGKNGTVSTDSTIYR
jgi:putative phosphotransacetylase